ncbi:MAG: hypothetical protein DRM98_04415, partial [Thermoplasmata archaeon]
MKRRNIKIDKKALTPVISLLLVIIIVSSSLSFILYWGVPYIENSKIEAQSKAVLSDLDSMDYTINSLIRQGSGAISKVDIDNKIDTGSITIDPVGDRCVVFYSFDPSYDFNVSGLDDSDESFTIKMESGSLSSVRIYWLNDTCFLAGTKVLMADNTLKNIEDIKPGEQVKTLDLKTNKLIN